MSIKVEDIAKRVADGEHIEVWSHTDGDGHKLSLEVSHVGFLIYIQGENRELIDNPFSYVCTESYLTFGMMEEILKTMNEYKHLVEEEFRDE